MINNIQDTQNINAIRNAIALIKNFVDYNNALIKLNECNKKASDNNLWNDVDYAASILKEKDRLETIINPINGIETKLNDIIELFELAESENDTDLLQTLSDNLNTLKKETDTLQLETLLSNKNDVLNCFLEINAGAGGTEAQDWAEMLARMYSRWADSKKYKIEITDQNIGEEAGVKSIVLHIVGNKAYGWLKKESGIHRLVRISPFDSNARRHTSFASVLVTPEIDNTIEIEINDVDLRIDVYRASGAGGQHVNKTESAVRITHIPTGIVTSSQIDRSQHRNKEIAMQMLRAKLYAKKLQEQQAEANASINKTDISWGNQIRSYVLQPYQMVKDLRTGVENTNAVAVLDGDINKFLEAAIAKI
ncbi:MAG: peptide chain release factor 2 [Alphaproteobacteria bacterium]|nr:peptide chain release factor 2 [Alphaproteobacteria bacterium]